MKLMKVKNIKTAAIYYFFLLLMVKANAQSDTPCSAPFLSVNTDSCVYISGTTVGASYQNNTLNGGTPPCASPGAADVWYRIIAPASGALAITTRQGTITDGGMAVYSGNCSNLNLISCNDDGAGNMMPVIDRSDYTPGDTLYLRFWKAWGSGTGTFDICVINSHSDCRSASFICIDRHIPKNAYGPGSNFDAYSSTNCGMTEYQSQWLRFSFLTSGTFQFTIYPDSLPGGFYPDYDWMLFQNNSPSFCNLYDTSMMPGVCNASSSQGLLGSTGIDATGVSNSVPAGPGNPFCPIMNVNAGEYYYMFINNFTMTSTGYSLKFGGTAVMDCNQTVGKDPLPEMHVSLHIYPDPVTDILTIETSEISDIEISNSKGQIIKRCKTAENKTSIDVSDFASGFYIIRAQTAKGVTTKKFIKN
jgi:hypothetical protein